MMCGRPRSLTVRSHPLILLTETAVVIDCVAASCSLKRSTADILHRHGVKQLMLAGRFRPIARDHRLAAAPLLLRTGALEPGPVLLTSRNGRLEVRRALKLVVDSTQVR